MGRCKSPHAACRDKRHDIACTYAVYLHSQKVGHCDLLAEIYDHFVKAK